MTLSPSEFDLPERPSRKARVREPHDRQRNVAKVIVEALARDRRVGWVSIFALTGAFPNVHGFLADGRALYVQVKAPGRFPTEAQRAFIDRARAAGCLAGVARSIDDAIAIIGGEPRILPARRD